MRDEQLTFTAFLRTVCGVVGGVLCALLVSWAVAYDRLETTGGTMALVLVACSAVGFIYAWRRGEWDATDDSEAESLQEEAASTHR